MPVVFGITFCLRLLLPSVCFECLRYSFRPVSSRVESFVSVSSCLASIRFVSFRFVSIRFASILRVPRFRFGAFLCRFVAFLFMIIRLCLVHDSIVSSRFDFTHIASLGPCKGCQQRCMSCPVRSDDAMIKTQEAILNLTTECEKLEVVLSPRGTMGVMRVRQLP